MTTRSGRQVVTKVPFGSSNNNDDVEVVNETNDDCNIEENVEGEEEVDEQEDEVDMSETEDDSSNSKEKIVVVKKKKMRSFYSCRGRRHNK